MYADNYAVKNVSFEVSKGEIVGFLGPNGAGKTTTMKILTGFISATEGTAKVKGLDVFEDSLSVRHLIGYLPENIPLYPELGVTDYLRFMSRLKGLPPKKMDDAIDGVIQSTGIKEMSKRPMGRLSKGYRQRVGLAQALLGNPEILILDEPTVGLDPAQIKEIRNLIRELGQEKTIILSTHILPEVEMLCDRVIIINKGEVIAKSTQDHLSQSLLSNENIELAVNGPREAVKSALKSQDEIISVGFLHEKDGVNYFKIEVREAGKSEVLAKKVVDAGWGLKEMRITRLSLEDIFVSLVTEEHL
jgi:ABC-2 type transport system ATP-binding protein